MLLTALRGGLDFYSAVSGVLACNNNIFSYAFARICTRICSKSMR